MDTQSVNSCGKSQIQKNRLDIKNAKKRISCHSTFTFSMRTLYVVFIEFGAYQKTDTPSLILMFMDH